MLKKLLYIFSILIIFFSQITFSQKNFANTSIIDSSISIDFSVVGDIMCHSTQYKYSMKEDSSFDFKPVYREIKEYFDNSDVVIGNLETVVAGEEVDYAGYPVFNTPEDFLKGLKYSGFDILVTANNHAYDQSKNGVINTIDFIHKNSLKNSGSYKTQVERDSIKLFEQSGVKFALLSYTYGVNGYIIPAEYNFLINRIDHELIRLDIAKAKSKNADLIIVYFHFGREYSRKANSYQKEIVEKTINYGADIILGAHPHTLQPVEFYKTVNAKIDSGFVAYSLGNYISNQRWRYADGGAILNFTVSKNFTTKEISLEGVRYLPIWIFKGVTNWGLEYRILPSEMAYNNSEPEYFMEEDKNLMLECYHDTKEIMEKRSTEILMDTMEKSNSRKWEKEQHKFRSFIAKIPYMTTASNTFVEKDDSLNYVTIEN